MENKESIEAKGSAIMKKGGLRSSLEDHPPKSDRYLRRAARYPLGERLHHRDFGQFQRVHRKGEKQKDVQHLRHRCSGTDQ